MIVDIVVKIIILYWFGMFSAWNIIDCFQDATNYNDLVTYTQFSCTIEADFFATSLVIEL